MGLHQTADVPLLQRFPDILGCCYPPKFSPLPALLLGKLVII